MKPHLDGPPPQARHGAPLRLVESGDEEVRSAGRELQTDVPWEHNVEAECAPTELPNSFQYITKRINNFKVRSSHSRTVACWAAGGDEVMTGLVLHTRGERGR
eukprot:238650-Prorocentrum_minimum.AAC.1